MHPNSAVPAKGVLEIGGSHVTAARVHPADWAVEIVQRTTLDPHAPADVLVADLAAAGQAVLSEGLTLAMPGPFDYEAGVAWYRGVEKFDALYGVDLRARLATALDLPGTALRFVNDAEAFAVGEWTAGTTQGRSSCVGVTLGTGVGSAFLRDGKAVRTGSDVPPNGELFRVVPPIEDKMSHRAIVGAYTRATQGTASEPKAGESFGVREIADRARAGEAEAIHVLDGAFTALAEALAPWARAFGVEAVVLGGSISGAFDLARPAFESALGLGVPVTVTADTETSALIGAAAR
ncbi:ROK family protein [Kribbella deserti]|uniref:ROK family protein n=1 Tax=Kribbella deserti TaxID=1926257 RepID=A0ABV6QW59_9ACTN